MIKSTYLPDKNKTLIIVEGQLEKEKMLKQLFMLFPELNVKQNNIVVYNTNIYKLEKAIIKEYGNSWADDTIDLAFIVGKDKDQDYRNEDFKDIFLVFDYDPQDGDYTNDRIIKLQNYFSDSTGEGKLYINYPMAESYLDFSNLDDESYGKNRINIDEICFDESRNVCGYKNKVANSSSIIKQIRNFETIYNKITDICVDSNKIELIFNEIVDLEICNEEISVFKNKISTVLGGIKGIDNSTKESICYYISSIMLDEIYKNVSGKTFIKKIKEIYKKIILCSIRKAFSIQEESENLYIENVGMEESCLRSINSQKILEKQINNKDTNNYIYVLNMSMMIIPDFNFSLLN